jgi:hypothetical protein
MDKSVRRVTVVQGGGENRQANVVYKSDDDEDSDHPRFSKLERSIRHYLKAQVIGAQEAYERHVASVEKGGSSWVVEGPLNLMKARRKANKEMRKASKEFPFKLMKFGNDDDDDDEGDK